MAEIILQRGDIPQDLLEYFEPADCGQCWICRLVEVFREVRRCLRPDGVMFLNCGDAYAGSWGNQGRKEERGTQRPINGGMISQVHDGRYPARGSNTGSIPPGTGLKPKDLVGQPWMLAFALRADGWWLRSDITWFKPNPMPESINGVRWEPHRVKDGDGEWQRCPGCPTCAPNDGLVLRTGSWRPTKAHELVFMLTKSADYYGDGEAVREAGHDWGQRDRSTAKHNGEGFRAHGQPPHRGLTNCNGSAGRNLRSVWTIATEPLPSIIVDGEKLDHFASYPTELARRCILAGTSAKGCCPACGAPWARVVERERGEVIDVRGYQAGVNEASPFITHGQCSPNAVGFPNSMQLAPRGGVRSKTTGWRPTCSCVGAAEWPYPRRDDFAPIPCRVLDPFGGSGRTALAAEELGRDCTLIELNPASVRMARAQLERAKARRYIGDDVTRDPADPRQGALL